MSLKDVITGNMLGDGNLQTFSNPPKSYRLRLGYKNLEYLEHLINIYKHWITQPEILQAKTTNTKYVNTTTQVELLPVAQLWYREGKKVLPANIGDLLTPKAIAYWFMDDGSIKDKKSKGLRISSESFTKNENERLCEVLRQKHNIKCHIYENWPNQWRIFISAKSYETFKKLVFPYMSQVPSMLYKIHL